MATLFKRRLRGPYVFLLTLLAIEFLDELVFGVREAAWPLIRNDLGLTYLQIGLLLALPGIASGILEPIFGVWGDLGARRRLILGGGIAFAGALVILGLSRGFPLLLLSFLVLYPASGAFVSLSQASLMDMDPERREQNMARWTLAGSVGVVGGPLLLGAAVGLGLGWRMVFIAMAVLSLILVVAFRRIPPSTDHPASPHKEEERVGFFQGLGEALGALRRGEVVRWLALLQLSDLMLDGLHGFLALYFADVVGLDGVQAGLAVAVWTGVGLMGDLALLPLLERVRGLTYLRVSVLVELILYPVFLLVPGLLPKLILLGLLGFFNAGWYSILKAQLYGVMPGQSGRVMTLNNLTGLVGSLIPLGVGWVAQRYNLGAAMWLLYLGPIALTLGLPVKIKEE